MGRSPHTVLHLSMSCQSSPGIRWAPMVSQATLPGPWDPVLPAVRLVSAAQTTVTLKYTLQYDFQKSDILTQCCTIFLTPSFTQPEAAFTWQRQHGFDNCQICSLCNHQAVSHSAGWMAFFLYTSFLLILQRFKLFSSFLKTLSWFYLVIMAEKCNNPIPGDLSTVHAGEKRVQTVLWMQKVS